MIKVMNKAVIEKAIEDTVDQMTKMRTPSIHLTRTQLLDEYYIRLYDLLKAIENIEDYNEVNCDG